MVLFGVATTQIRAEVTFDTIVIGGGPAPGVPGAFIADPIVPPGSLFIDLALNARGEVACAFGLEGPDVADNNLAAWVGRPGDLKLLARKGDPAPGAPNTIFLSVGGTFDASFNDLGQVAFITFLGGVGADFSNNLGIWFGTPGDLRLVARKGSAFPGTVDGALFNEFGDIRLTAAGDQPVLMHQAAITGGAVTPDNDTVIFAGAPGVQQFLARENDLAVPNNSNPLFGAKHAQFSFASMNRRRSVVFQSRLRGLDVGFTNSEALFFANASTSPTLIVRAGTQAQPGLTIGLIGTSPFINDDNKMAFTATLFDNANQPVGDSLWTASGSGIQLRAKFGDSAPGTGGAFFDTDASNFLVSGFNRMGDILFSAAFEEFGLPPTNGRGLFVFRENSIRLLARVGDPAPEMPGVTFGSVNGGLNGNGQVAFTASLQGPEMDDDINTTEGLWLIERDGAMRAILKAGDTIDLGDGVPRTVRLVSPPPRALGEQGRSSTFNDAGQIAIIVHCTDGASAALVANTTPSDRDADGAPDDADGCPDDAGKTAPGACGCGVSDADSDGDGIADCVDSTDSANPADPSPTESGDDQPAEESAETTQQLCQVNACGVCIVPALLGSLAGICKFKRRTRCR